MPPQPVTEQGRGAAAKASEPALAVPAEPASGLVASRIDQAQEGMDELISHVAKAIADPGLYCDFRGDRGMSLWQAEAAVLAVFARADAVSSLNSGQIMVPTEPTEAMLDAYWHQTGESREMRMRTHARMRRYWAAMIGAQGEVK